MSTTFRSMGMSIVEIGLPSFVLSLAGSLTSYGIIIGTFSVTQCIFQFPYAALSDRIGRRKIVLMGMLIYITGTFLCFFAQSVMQLIIFRAIQGAGAYTSILQAIIGDIYKKDQHGKGMGYYSLFMNIGYFLGIILGGFIANFLGFRNIFSVSGLLVCFSTIFMFFVLKDNNKDVSSDSQNDKMDINIKNIKVLIKERQFGASVTLNCVRWFLFGFITAYLIWVLQVQFGLSEIDTSYILLLIVALYVGFVFLSSFLLDRQGPRKMMIIGQSIVIIFGVFFFVPNILYNFIFFLIVVSFIGIGIALFDPAGNTLLLEVVEDIEPRLKGSGIGFNNAIGFFCGAIGPIIMIPLGELDVFFPFYILFSLMIFSLIFTLTFVDKKY